MKSQRVEKLEYAIKQYRNDLNQDKYQFVGQEIIEPQKIIYFEDEIGRLKQLIVENANQQSNFWNVMTSMTDYSQFTEINQKAFVLS